MLAAFAFFLVLPNAAAAAGCSGTGNCYWVDAPGTGAGNWSNTAKWATASGGAVTGGLPTATDNVHFNALSSTTAYTVTVDAAAVMNDLMFDAAPSVSGTITWAGSANMTISSSTKLLAGMTNSYTGLITFNATAIGKTITSNGVVFANSTTMTFDGVGGAWALADAFSGGQFTLTNGSFDTAGKTVSARGFLTTAGTFTLSLGASVITVPGGVNPLNFNAGTLTFNPGTSSITFNNLGGNVLAGNGKTFYDVSILGASNIGITGANTFHNLTFTGSGNSNYYVLYANQTVTGTFSAPGTGPAGVSRMLVLSDTVGTARTITAAAVSLTDVDFTDITGAGVAAPFTGTRLGNAAGNSGITFISSNKYWVGNQAFWNAANVWALTSGGAGATANYPLPQDTAIFDTNSFSTNGQTVTFQTQGKFPTFDFSAINKTVTVYMEAYPYFYGNAVLSPNVTMTGHPFGPTFMGRKTQTVTSAGVAWAGPSMTIDSLGGTVQLIDNLTIDATKTFTLTNGTLNLNGKTLSTGNFSSTNSNIRAITAGGGGITTTGPGYIWNSFTATNLTLNDALLVTSTYSGATTLNVAAGGTAAQVPSIAITAGTGQFILDSGLGVKNLDLTGFSGTFVTNNNTIYGNLIIPASGVTLPTSSAAITFSAPSGTQTITTNGKTLDFPITVNAPGATVQLAGNLSVGTNGNSRALTLTAGTLDLNGKTLTTDLFSGSGSTARTIKSSAAGGVLATAATSTATVFDMTTATNATIDRTNPWSIQIGGNTTNVRTFAGGGLTWPALSFTNTTTGGELDFTGSNTFKSLTVSTPPQTLKFTAGTTNTIEDNGGFPSGAPSRLVTVAGITASTFTLAKSGGGQVCTDYLSLTNSTGSPASTWYAGANSTNGGGNTNWSFAACPASTSKNLVSSTGTSGGIVATGGTITTITQNGVRYRVHTFTSSDTFTVTSGSGNVQYLVVGGGGAGGWSEAANSYSGAGGGAGGFRTNTTPDYLVSAGSYTVTVGSGGVASASSATNGGNSVFGAITSIGGGAGAGGPATPYPARNGSNGGSGGGSANNGTIGTGTAGQGNNGGLGGVTGGASGGGGGAGGVGQDTNTGSGGNGGSGLSSTISGTSVAYAGGGGGGAYNNLAGTASAGGGAGGALFSNGTAGTANTGGGGGGGGEGGVGQTYSGGNGGSGIVIIRYPISVSTQVAPPSSGLVGWWTFDSGDITDKIYDRSGQANNGYFVGSATSTAKVAGKVGQALSFNGVNNYAVTGNIPLTSAFTASVWVKPRVTPQGATTRILETSYITGFYLGTDSTGTKYQLYFNGVAAGTDPTNFTAGNWDHLALVVNGTSAKLYRNGVVTIDSTITALGAVSLPLYIGAWYGGPSSTYNWNGLEDDVRIYNRALTYAEVAALYNANATTQSSVAIVNTAIPSLPANGLVGYWSFNGPDMAGADGSQLTAYDRSGQGNTATSTGGVSRTIGKIGQALTFDGTTGLMNAGAGSSLNLTSALTMSAWVNITVNKNYNQILVKNNDNVNYYGLVVDSVGNFQIQVGNSGLKCPTGGSVTNLTAKKWYHVAGTYDGSRCKIYINGALDSDTAAVAGGAGITAANLTIGQDAFNSRAFGGAIDEVRLYNRALGASEIQLLYNSGK